MSRVGKAPITIPSGVEVSFGTGEVTVKGPKGTLTQEIPGDITLREEDGSVLVERPDDSRQNRSLHGLVRALVSNMVEGVTNEFTKELEIIGVGYRAAAAGPNKLDLALGFDKAAALMIGICDNCGPEHEDISLTLDQTLDLHLKPLVIPAVSGYSIGHIRNQFTLPMGIRATLDTHQQTVTLLESAVS